MKNRTDYLARLQVAVEHLHDCGAVYHSTVPVHEVFKGQTVWAGLVEVFNLRGHPKSKRAYAWSHLDKSDDSEERFVAVLEIPPVESAVTAVRASIVADGKKRKEKNMKRHALIEIVRAALFEGKPVLNAHLDKDSPETKELISHAVSHGYRVTESEKGFNFEPKQN